MQTFERDFFETHFLILVITIEKNPHWADSLQISQAYKINILLSLELELF